METYALVCQPCGFSLELVGEGKIGGQAPSGH